MNYSITWSYLILFFIFLFYLTIMTIINNNKNKLEELEQYQNKSWLQKIKHNLKKIYSSKETWIWVRAVCKTSWALLFSALLASFWGRESEKQYVKNYMKFEGAPTEINHIDSNETEAIDMLTQIKNNTKTLASFKTLYKSIKREDLKDDAELTNKQIEDILRKGFDKHKSERRYISLLVTILLAWGVMWLAWAGVVAYKLWDNQYNEMMQHLSDMLDDEKTSLARAKDQAQSDAIERLGKEKTQLQDNLNEWKQKFEKDTTNNSAELWLIETIQQALNTNDNNISDKITTIINQSTEILNKAETKDLIEVDHIGKTVTNLYKKVDNKLHELKDVQRSNIKINNNKIEDMMKALQTSYNKIIQQEAVQQAVKTFVDQQAQEKDTMIQKLQQHEDLTADSVETVTTQREVFKKAITDKMKKATISWNLTETNKIIKVILYGNSKDDKSFDDYLKSQNIDIDTIIQDATDTIKKQEEAKKDQAEKEQRITTVKKLLTNGDQENVDKILSKLPFAKEEDMEKIEEDYNEWVYNITQNTEQIDSLKDSLNNKNFTIEKKQELINIWINIFSDNNELKETGDTTEIKSKISTLDQEIVYILDRIRKIEEKIKDNESNKKSVWQEKVNLQKERNILAQKTISKQQLEKNLLHNVSQELDVKLGVLKDLLNNWLNILNQQFTNLKQETNSKKEALEKRLEEQEKITNSPLDYFITYFPDLEKNIEDLIKETAETENETNMEKISELEKKQFMYNDIKAILSLLFEAQNNEPNEIVKNAFWNYVSELDWEYIQSNEEWEQITVIDEPEIQQQLTEEIIPEAPKEDNLPQLTKQEKIAKLLADLKKINW